MPKTIERELRDGTKISVVEKNFETIREEWNEYKLEDGTIVRAKTIVSNIYRAIDENGNEKYTDDGEPYIVVTSMNLITAKEAGG